VVSKGLVEDKRELTTEEKEEKWSLETVRRRNKKRYKQYVSPPPPVLKQREARSRKRARTRHRVRRVPFALASDFKLDSSPPGVVVTPIPRPSVYTSLAD